MSRASKTIGNYWFFYSDLLTGKFLSNLPLNTAKQTPTFYYPYAGLLMQRTLTCDQIDNANPGYGKQLVQAFQDLAVEIAKYRQ